jgi:quinol monooxygenase YgiN
VIMTILKIVPLAEKRKVVLEILRSVESALRGRAACLDCGVFEQSGDDSVILYLDRWLSAEELSRHLRSDLFSHVLVAMELASGPPVISFHTVSKTVGLHWIEILRGEKSEVGPAQL